MGKLASKVAFQLTADIKLLQGFVAVPPI